MKGAPITTGKSGLQCAFITPVIFTNYTVFPGIPFLKKGNIQSQKTLPAIFDEPQGKKSPLQSIFDTASPRTWNPVEIPRSLGWILAENGMWVKL